MKKIISIFIICLIFATGAKATSINSSIKLTKMVNQKAILKVKFSKAKVILPHYLCFVTSVEDCGTYIIIHIRCIDMTDCNVGPCN